MSSITTLVSFSDFITSSPIFPQGALVADANGDLFGTTIDGGAGNDGIVFEVAKTDSGYASSPTTLVSFNGANGATPVGNLIADGNGDLFGTTEIGGAHNDGTVFEIAKTASGYAGGPTTLVSFNGTGGSLGLIADANGDLFGTAGGGPDHDGTVFEIIKTANGYASSLTTLVSFNGTNGMEPGGLIADANGDLFGTTGLGGAHNDGTVFEIAKTATGYASSPTTLVSFDLTNGASPGGLIADANGDLFGTTDRGGADNNGVVFEVAKTDSGYASSPTSLVSFNGTNGARPDGGLTADANGDLVGTTVRGGADNEGTVFEIAKTDSGYASSPTTLVSFNGTNGSFPFGSLITDANGDLFGTTNQGGPGGEGTVFEITPLCFLAGTRIATPAGEVPVERLAVGDLVNPRCGEPRRIVWIGKGKMRATRGRRDAATPVIVRKGALADNVPHCDLRITKAHSLYIDGVLIPVEFLVNHRSILWDDWSQDIELYHVELESHDVLIANGAPAESYRDDGNRWLFQNANTGWDLPPHPPCAPVLTGGPIVDAVWRRLLDRSEPRAGFPLTGDPDLHLLVNDWRIDAVKRVGASYIFRLPDGLDSALRIVSRAAVPQELGLARDPRSLGVALRQIIVRQGTRFRITKAADPRLGKGFHAFEADNNFRWTTGDATLPVELFVDFTGPVEVVLMIANTTQYIDKGCGQQIAA